jgi:outer membrane lipoprotein-sorting protein
MTISCGCGTGNETVTQPGDDGGPNPNKTADTVLDNLFAAYAKANSYRDQAIVTAEFKHPDGDQQQQLKLHVALQRPNLARIERDGVLVVSDGETIHGRPDG